MSGFNEGPSRLRLELDRVSKDASRRVSALLEKQARDLYDSLSGTHEERIAQCETQSVQGEYRWRVCPKGTSVFDSSWPWITVELVGRFEG